MRTREQEYAARIYQQVQGLKERQSRKEYQKYGVMAHKLPVLIRTAGLVQALAFVNARDEEMHNLLLTNIAETCGFSSQEELLARSREAPLAAYMRLSQQVMATLLWYKRFAQSILNVQVTDETDDELPNAEVTASAVGEGVQRHAR